MFQSWIITIIHGMKSHPNLCLKEILWGLSYFWPPCTWIHPIQSSFLTARYPCLVPFLVPSVPLHLNHCQSPWQQKHLARARQRPHARGPGTSLAGDRLRSSNVGRNCFLRWFAILLCISLLCIAKRAFWHFEPWAYNLGSVCPSVRTHVLPWTAISQKCMDQIVWNFTPRSGMVWELCTSNRFFISFKMAAWRPSWM